MENKCTIIKIIEETYREDNCFVYELIAKNDNTGIEKEYHINNFDIQLHVGDSIYPTNEE
jgi:hypothetical protein